MHAPRCTRPSAALVLLLCGIHPSANAQTAPSANPAAPVSHSSIADETAQTAEILGLAPSLATLQTLQAQRPCTATPTLQELALRQQMLESVEISSLDVDDVLNQISNERDKLSELRASLQARRDHTVTLLNSAALLTGSGLGVAVSATQFSTLGQTAQNVGNGVGVGSAFASTLLSYLAIRKQAGGKTSVGSAPNMLAPLFDQPAAFRTHYPPVILQYLNTVPAGEAPSRGTRLEQLRAHWAASGRMDTANAAKRSKQITLASSSENPEVKVAIPDLSARMAMLEDVADRVALLKRDLARLMHLYVGPAAACNPS